MSTSEPVEDTLMEGGLYDDDDDEEEEEEEEEQNDGDLENLINDGSTPDAVTATATANTTPDASKTTTEVEINKQDEDNDTDMNEMKSSSNQENENPANDNEPPQKDSSPDVPQANNPSETIAPISENPTKTNTAVVEPKISSPEQPSKEAMSSPPTTIQVSHPPPPPQTAQPSPSNTAPKASSKLTPPSTTVLEANNEIANLLLANKISNDESSKLQAILRENAQLKDKITKLKTLLARSSKVSKEQKQDLETHKKLLDIAQDENERLKIRLETLANRPSHMDLLADFDTNFDKALLSMANQQDEDENGVNASSQSGGEATTSYLKSNSMEEGENVSSMLLTELSQAKSRIEQLEGTNESLMKRSGLLEDDNMNYQQERQSVNLKMSNLQLELRMARMETENATRAMREKASSLAEMQMEIDLVTKSAMNANARAAEGIEVVKSVKTDKAHVKELEAKVAALQEWAIASASAKEITLEQNKDLQKRLDAMIEEAAYRDATAATEEASKGDKIGSLALRKKSKATSVIAGDLSVETQKWDSSIERRLWTKSSSLVVGAGMVMSHIIKLGDCHIGKNESVLLRWKFDITPNDVDIVFSILKGQYEDHRAMREADAIMRNRTVVSGGGGEVQGAFVKQNACTLVWSNQHSWVRPRSIKYVVEAFAVM